MLRVIGAGVGRTGTMSLKEAFERLLGGPCHHMIEVFGQPDQIATWRRAVAGEPVDWPSFLGDYSAIVDFPGALFWPELSESFPDAVVVLSTRRSAEEWWLSADRTIFASLRRDPGSEPVVVQQREMIIELFATRFATCSWDDAQATQTAYERHNAAVRAGVEPERLVEWQPGDGWGPLCAALGVDVPDEEFPHTNTTEEFRAMLDLDDVEAQSDA
ncbi:MAG: sulfotransferase family protein [Acidimicrobiales bacterium]